MNASKKKELFLKELTEKPIYSLDNINYFIHKNTNLITTIFLDVNLMIFTYPLQTIKTRIQSRHMKQDICHYIKNNVEKARKYTLIISGTIWII